MEVKRGPILFRCDGTPDGGWEPFYHCLTLAASLQRRRRGTHFLSYLEPLSLAQVIHRGNNEWSPAAMPMGAPGDVEATCREARRLDAAAVVFAGKSVSEDAMRAVARTGAKVLVIDSEAANLFPAAIVVNPSLAPGLKAYKVERGGQLLLGRKFSLVRGVFRRQRTIRATEQPGPFRALVAMGDDDVDQAYERTSHLLEMPQVDKISIACRTHHPRYYELRELADEAGGRVELVTEPKELMTRLVRSHFALTSGDAWALEIACVGIPQLLLPTKPGHVLNAKRMDDEGAATFLGAAADVDFKTLAEAVSVVLEDPMERLGMTRCARNLIDGRGGDRVVNGLEIVLHSPTARKPVELRIAA